MVVAVVTKPVALMMEPAGARPGADVGVTATAIAIVIALVLYAIKIAVILHLDHLLFPCENHRTP